MKKHVDYERRRLVYGSLLVYRQYLPVIAKNVYRVNYGLFSYVTINIISQIASHG